MEVSVVRSCWASDDPLCDVVRLDTPFMESTLCEGCR